MLTAKQQVNITILYYCSPDKKRTSAKLMLGISLNPRDRGLEKTAEDKIILSNYIISVRIKKFLYIGHDIVKAIKAHAPTHGGRSTCMHTEVNSNFPPNVIPRIAQVSRK